MFADDDDESCDHSCGVEQDGDLLVWRCEECGALAPWSADVRLGWYHWE